MKNFNDTDLKPEQSWLKAEKMLDKHFKRKRVIAWTLALFISAAVITGSLLLLNQPLEKSIEASSTPERNHKSTVSSSEKILRHEEHKNGFEKPVANQS